MHPFFVLKHCKLTVLFHVSFEPTQLTTITVLFLFVVQTSKINLFTTPSDINIRDGKMVLLIICQTPIGRRSTACLVSKQSFHLYTDRFC